MLDPRYGGTIRIKANEIGNENQWQSSLGSGDQNKIDAVHSDNSGYIYVAYEDGTQSFGYENVTIPMGNEPTNAEQEKFWAMLSKIRRDVLKNPAGSDKPKKKGVPQKSAIGRIRNSE
jgi:hypothetical protein